MTLVDVDEVNILVEDEELGPDNICEVVVDGSEVEITVLGVVAKTGSVLLVGLEVCGSEVVVDDGSRVSVVEDVRKTVVTAVEEVSEIEVVTDSVELVLLLSVDVSLVASEVDASVVSVVLNSNILGTDDEARSRVDETS